jgi:hypothetical protein
MFTAGTDVEAAARRFAEALSRMELTIRITGSFWR